MKSFQVGTASCGFAKQSALQAATAIKMVANIHVKRDMLNETKDVCIPLL